MRDRVLQPREGSVVKECLLQSHISQRRCAKLVAVCGIPADLLQPEVFILPGSVEDHVALAEAELGRNLWHADDVHFEVAEHLVGLAGNGVANHTAGLSEKEQRALFLGKAHRPALTAREVVDRRIGENERELELRDGAAEHREIERSSGGDAWKQLPEQPPISRRRIESLEYRLADGFIARAARVGRRNDRTLAVIELIEIGSDRSGSAGESSHLNQLGG